MTVNRRVLYAGTFGSFLAAVILLLMAVIFLPSGFEYPGADVLTGRTVLSAGELDSFLKKIRLIFILDTMFLFGWLLSWSGIASAVYSRQRLLGIMTLVFGICGALLDFTENSMVWGAAEALMRGIPVNSVWISAWKSVQHMSYLLPFAGAVFASFGLWDSNLKSRVTAFTGTVVTAAAVIGLYVPTLSLFSNLWFLLWFIASGILLFDLAVRYQKTDQTGHRQ